MKQGQTDKTREHNAVGSDGWLRLWDNRSRRPFNSVNLRKGVDGWASWSPGGSLLSVGFASGAIIVVDSLISFF
jgi:hypothetical protein